MRPEGALARGIYSLLLPRALGIEAGWPKRREAVRGEAREPGLQGNAGESLREPNAKTIG